MCRFNNDKEVIKYISTTIKEIEYLVEHRLYKEEQILGIQNYSALKVRNCLEWIIRINNTLKFLKLSLGESLKFAIKMKLPIEETEEKQWYTYHLENACYREMIIWELLKQLLNEFFDLGFDKKDDFNIFNVTKNMLSNDETQKKLSKEIFKHLKGDIHDYVRKYLRNSFTHSTDPTCINYFHEIQANGLISPTLDMMFPDHQFEALIKICDDLKQALNFLNKVNDSIEEVVVNEVMMVQPYLELKCGKRGKIKNRLMISTLKEISLINFTCGFDECSTCKYKIIDDKEEYCYAKKIIYCRIYEIEKEFELQLNEKKL